MTKGRLLTDGKNAKRGHWFISPAHNFPHNETRASKLLNLSLSIPNE